MPRPEPRACKHCGGEVIAVGPIREWGGKWRVWCLGYRVSSLATRELSWASCGDDGSDRGYYVT